MPKPIAIISNKVYVPAKEVDLRALKKHFHIHHFNTKACNTADNGSVCEHKDERPNDVCQNCPAYHGLFKFYEQKKIKGKKHIGVSKGDMKKVEEVIGGLKRFKVKDKRRKKKMQHKLRMKKSFVPRDHQPGAVKAMIKAGGGILVAPPRSGKTAIVAMTSVELGLKSIVLAHQDDLIDQFYETYKNFTNMEALEEKYGIGSVVRVCKTADDWLSDADIKLGTYQKFIRSTKSLKLFLKVLRMAGAGFVDEGHKANARAFAMICALMNLLYQYALTATPDRKDGLEFISYCTFGPICHTVEIESMKPIVHAHISKSKAKTTSQNWVSIMKQLCNNKTRRAHIVDLIIKDVEAGHSVCVAVAPLRQPILQLVEDVNRAWMDKHNTLEPIAEPFFRYANPEHKKAVLNRARDGSKTKVLICMRSMLTGVDVPRWSSFINVTPTNNAPNWKQESMRVCTPMEGKKQPIIRMIVDLACQPSMSCFQATIGYSKQFGYKMHKSVKEVTEEVGKASGKRWTGKHENQVVSIGRPGRAIVL